jgi:DNA recombination protein RmuC
MEQLQLIAALGLVAALALLALLILGFSRRRSGMETAFERLLAAQEETVRRVERHVSVQLADVGGRLAEQTAQQASKHGELTVSLNQRLDSLGQRVGSSLTDQAQKTAKALGDLEARLRTIDAAQANIINLSSEVVSLQDILSNKQARGAFGQGQMETIIADSLPAGAYEFQAQLSNGTRPDCVIRLPRALASIVVDAKFPRESFAALAEAEGPDAVRAAQARVRSEMRKHVDDIAAKYLIPGETQDPAIMFLPAESIFCTVFSEFFDVIQHAQRKQVALVSPNMLMLAVNTMRALMRDQRMREQAHVIQEEVRKLMDDVSRLAERADNLKRHLGMAEKDIREIETSTAKILSRGERIMAVEMADGAKPEITERRPPVLASAG